LTRARAGRSDPGIYPEREPARDSALDRFAANLGFGMRNALRRTLARGSVPAAEVARRAQRAARAPLAAQARELRYRLRRDGLGGDALVDCFALHAAALPGGASALAPEALDAAGALVRGSIVDIADPASRGQALALAAAAFALCGVPVQVHAASEARARAAAAALRPPLEALGLGVACVDAGMSPEQRRIAYGAPVVCGTQRLIGFDYLRDRVRLGRRLRPMQGRIEWLSGGTGTEVPLLLPGLHCALVEDADQVLLDDARAPMVVGADAPASSDRLPYEQALEMARALQAQTDYAIDEHGAQLSARGAQRLGELSVLLGGIWAARQRREELVAAALTALHALQRDRDYQVERGVLRLAADEAGEEPAPSETLQRLLEVKEGLAFGGRREVLARLSVPRFYGRFLRLAGVCADARGLERELWSLYGLRTLRAGAPAGRGACALRVYAEPAQRRRALAASVREHAGRGEAVVVALRAAEEAAAVAAALEGAGLQFGVLQAAAAGAEGEAPGSVLRPGAVLLCVHPAQRDIVPRAAGAVPVHVAIAELQDAARASAQTARAFGARSCEQFLALGDEAVAKHIGRTARAARAWADGEGRLPAALGRWVAARAQSALERAAARGRREALARERSLEDLLAFSGLPE
jgi:preprotein translocase subunit SecA